MIKANELRIRNLVLADGNTFKVEGIDLSGVNDGDRFRFNYDKLEGIPITPEMLEKIGLEFISKQGYFNLPLPNSLYGITNIKIGTGPYLHQVQNLYFALTGEELNVQL